MNHLWYKNAIFYSLDVETFYDANGDGIGDFQGLIEKLDYLSGLGVNCLWLLPFYPSPNRDNGYDVTDYYNIDSRLGTLGDFAEFMDKSAQLGIRIVIDLVVNHTSIDHPWFKEAAENAESKFFNYYVWSEKPEEHGTANLMLKGEVDTVWTYNQQIGKYYLHRFYKEQPDLNIANSEVRMEILRIMGFWLRLGVSGFRIDAAELLIEPYGTPENNKYNLQCFLEEMRQFISSRNSDAILLAETNVQPNDLGIYLNKERMHMAFNFFLNQHLFLSLASTNTGALVKALQKLPKLQGQNQWLNFLRHHDELSLKLVNNQQSKVIYQEFAPEEEMKVFGSGIRRRLAPMMKGDIDFMKLAFSLLFSLPGIAMIRYGDEIGMGDNLNLPGRNSVRTPMQWSSMPNAGFSSMEKHVIPAVINDKEFGFEKVNVIAQKQDPSSFLNWIERLIAARKHFPEIGYGEVSIIKSKHRSLLIHTFIYRQEKAHLIHNLSKNKLSVNLTEHDIAMDCLYELFGDERSEFKGGRLMMSGYGYKWFKYKMNRT